MVVSDDSAPKGEPMKTPLRVLIVEKTTAFPRKVGEASVEVSGYFLGRVLGLTQHLNEAHLVKQGMRFWFFNSRTQSFESFKLHAV